MAAGVRRLLFKIKLLSQVERMESRPLKKRQNLRGQKPKLQIESTNESRFIL